MNYATAVSLILSYYSFPTLFYELNCLLSFMGLKPITFGLASLANHYTNVTQMEWEKKTYIFFTNGIYDLA